MKTNILFVCRYNRFRSRIAEAYFKKINKNKDIQAKSAGLFKGRPLSPNTVKKAREFGLDIRGRVKGLSSELMVWQNMVVNMADDVPMAVFNRSKKMGKKVISWKIKDADYKDTKSIEKLIKRIMTKVDKLNKELSGR